MASLIRKYLPYFVFCAAGSLVIIATATSGTLYDSSCTRTLFAVLLRRHETSSTCDSVPYLTDLPSLVLTATSVGSMVSHYFIKRLEAQFELVRNGGLMPDLTPDQLDLTKPLEQTRGQKFLAVTSRTPAVKVAVCVFVGAVGILLYHAYVGRHYFFTDLNNALPPANNAHVESNWWASWHQHHLASFLWWFIGSYGTCFAAGDMFSYVRISSRFKKLHSSRACAYVPTFPGLENSWTYLQRLLSIKVWGMVIFAFAYSAVVFMTRTPNGSTADTVLVLLVAFVLVVSAYQIVPLRNTIARAHTATVTAEWDELSTRMRARPTDFTAADDARLNVLLQYSELPKLRSARFLARCAIVASGLAAFIASILSILGG